MLACARQKSILSSTDDASSIDHISRRGVITLWLIPIDTISKRKIEELEKQLEESRAREEEARAGVAEERREKEEARAREAEERREKEEVKAREGEECRKNQKTTLSEYLYNCHFDLYRKLRLAQALKSSTGLVTSVDSRYYPR